MVTVPWYYGSIYDLRVSNVTVLGACQSFLFFFITEVFRVRPTGGI